MRAKLLISFSLVAFSAYLQFRLYGMVRWDEERARDGQELAAPFNEKIRKGELLTPEEEARLQDITIQHPASYYTLNSLKSIIIIQLILVLIAVGLPYADSSRREAGPGS